MLRAMNFAVLRSLFPGRTDLVLLCSSAVLLVLSFPVLNLSFCAWAALVPWFVALEKKSAAQAFVSSYVCGVLFWLGTVYWLVHVTAAGMLVLVLYLSLYWGIFGCALSWSAALQRKWAVMFVPALWVLLEYIRSHALTGFPWALAAYTQSQTPAVIQIADITGAWGVSFLVVMVNAAAYAVLRPFAGSGRLAKMPVMITGCVFVAAYIYGAARVHQISADSKPEQKVTISVVQGNIPQAMKWDSAAREYIMQVYTGLSRNAAADGPALIVWPEAAVPVALSEDSEYRRGLQGFVESLRVDLLTGAVTYRDARYYNSAVLFSGNGPAQTYDKIHLVPFGEYIPLRAIFGFLETIVPIGEVQRGAGYRVFRSASENGSSGFSFSSLICYEDVFPEISRNMVRAGAQFLVTVTNDAWYERTSAPYQHFQAAVFRAIENRVWMIRSANTGVSGFIRPDGISDGVVADAAGRHIFVAGYLTRAITIVSGGKTVYTRFGDWFIAAAVVLIILCYAPGSGAARGARRRP